MPVIRVLQPKLPTVGVEPRVLEQLAAADPPVTTIEELIQQEQSLYSKTSLSPAVRSPSHPPHHYPLHWLL